MGRIKLELAQVWEGAGKGATAHWNDEFDEQPERGRSADKRLAVARAGIQR